MKYEIAKTALDTSFRHKENKMNQDILQGKWKQLKGKVKQRWGELTDDDLNRVEGNYQELVGIVQEKYGRSRAEAEEEVREFMDDLL
jgi:uncharacterized protein YjbJ (UPF0337 family)